MTDTYLSPAELRELTGCAHRDRQAKWLKAQRTLGHKQIATTEKHYIRRGRLVDPAK